MQLLRSVEDGKFENLMVQELADSDTGSTAPHPVPEQPRPPTMVTTLVGPALTASTSSTSLDLAPVLETVDPVLETIDPVLEAIDPVLETIDPVLEAIDPVLELDVAALQADYSELSRKFKALSTHFKFAKDLLRKRVDERDGWAIRAARLEKLILLAEKKHGINILEPRSPQAPVAATADVDDYALKQDAGVCLNNRSEGIATEPEACQETRNVGAEQRIPNEQSESTQGDTDDGSNEQLPQLPPANPNGRVLIKQEPSSDEPVLVSERVVRKRKRGDSVTRAVEQRPKQEPTDNSSPILSRINFACGTQEDVDLGDIEQRIVTPRKQKESVQSEQAGSTATPRSKTSYAAHSVSSHRHEQFPQQTTLNNQPSVLTPVSVNVQRCGLSESKPTGRRVRRGIAFAISALAEDGVGYRAPTSATRNQSPATAHTSAKGPSVKCRLHTLLNSPSAAPSNSVTSRSGSKSRERPTAADEQSPIPERRMLPFSRDIAQPGKSPLFKAGSSTPRSAPPSGDGRVLERSPPRNNKKRPASSLRAKPPLELQLDDFKVNPLANNGHDFAFADVVRDKGERACLPGCTDLHCCGKQFKALALSQRPDPPLTPTQRMEEQKLLEEYLADHAYRLATMSRDERAELWVEAKTQELANRYGKHKHRFSRMQSPPGFWNADFPSTQELQADRAEAARRERQAVAERHREAMRPGGRWLFKDE